MGQLGCDVHQLTGDTIVIVFDQRGDQPDHACSRLPDGALVEQLPPFQLKGRSQPVTAYILRDPP